MTIHHIQHSHHHQFLIVSLLVFVDGGAGGPAAAERGSSQRPRAVGEGEQDRRGSARGHGHINHPDLGSAVLSSVLQTQSPRTPLTTLIQGQWHVQTTGSLLILSLTGRTGGKVHS